MWGKKGGEKKEEKERGEKKEWEELSEKWSVCDGGNEESTRMKEEGIDDDDKGGTREEEEGYGRERVRGREKREKEGLKKKVEEEGMMVEWQKRKNRKMKYSKAVEQLRRE